MDKESDITTNKIIIYLKILINDIFIVSLLTYFTFHLIDFFYKGFITNYFNINIILIICLISSFLVFILSDKEQSTQIKNNKVKGLLINSSISLLSAIIIHTKIDNLGNISILISLISGILIFLLSYQVLNNKFENK